MSDQLEMGGGGLRPAATSAGERGCDLASEYGVSRATVSRIVNGLRWKHLP